MVPAQRPGFPNRPTRTATFARPTKCYLSELDELNRRDPRLAGATSVLCGYCSAPLGQKETCLVCGETTDVTPAVDKIDRELAQIYQAKRKREGLYVHLAAWSGILLATALSILMILLLPGWTKVFAIVFLVLGGYFAGVFFGNVLIQGFAYRAGLNMFAKRWAQWRASSGATRSAG